MQIGRIRLSDKISRLHPRRAAPKLGQTYEPEVLVKVREWIAPALTSPDLVLGAQPPTHPHRRVGVERTVRLIVEGQAGRVGVAERFVVLAGLRG